MLRSNDVFARLLFLEIPRLRQNPKSTSGLLNGATHAGKQTIIFAIFSNTFILLFFTFCLKLVSLNRKL